MRDMQRITDGYIHRTLTATGLQTSGVVLIEDRLTVETQAVNAIIRLDTREQGEALIAELQTAMDQVWPVSPAPVKLQLDKDAVKRAYRSTAGPLSVSEGREV